jgi:hypothetical protein
MASTGVMVNSENKAMGFNDVPRWYALRASPAAALDRPNESSTTGGARAAQRGDRGVIRIAAPPSPSVVTRPTWHERVLADDDGG